MFGFFFFFKQKTAYEIGVRLVGSEMCIRDSSNRDPALLQLDLLAVVHDVVEHLLHGRSHRGRALDGQTHHTVFLRLDGVDLHSGLAVPQQHLRHDGNAQTGFHHGNIGLVIDCLLYTSDAADEEDSVDLGGRRII